jgi:peptidoglycan/LPS O-acetylase OafA/YrhL
MERVQGLDSIRFVAALVVLLGHLPPPHLSHASALLTGIASTFALVFNGPAAVIVFFVVSGFCIHYPLMGSGRIELRYFYIRRAIRLFPPAIAAAAMYAVLGVDLSFPQFGVLWSIICEGIYYVLYPLLYAVAKRFGWTPLCGAAYVIAYALGVSKHGALTSDYTALGVWTWVIGLPCWLLGCVVAENLRHVAAPRDGEIWRLRLYVALSMIVLRVAKFHGDSALWSNVFTLNFFSPLYAYWLAKEIQRCGSVGASGFLEAGGGWSYSLYLVHPIVIVTVTPVLIAASGWAVGWSASVGIALCLSYAFYLLVERPSHSAAKRLARVARASVRAESPLNASP